MLMAVFDTSDALSASVCESYSSARCPPGPGPGGVTVLGLATPLGSTPSHSVTGHVRTQAGKFQVQPELRVTSCHVPRLITVIMMPGSDELRPLPCASAHQSGCALTRRDAAGSASGCHASITTTTTISGFIRRSVNWSYWMANP
eukprot:1057958-Rhodomonas_salina.6